MVVARQASPSVRTDDLLDQKLSWKKGIRFAWLLPFRDTFEWRQIGRQSKMISYRLSTTLREERHGVEFFLKLLTEHFGSVGILEDGGRCGDHGVETETSINILDVDETFKETVNFGSIGYGGPSCRVGHPVPVRR